MYDVFGIGNPMLDLIIKVDDEHILDLDLRKGTVKFVDEDTSIQIISKFNDKEVLFIPGGDVVNTLTGIARMGGQTIFCGKVGLDEHGILIEETMVKDGVKPVLIKGNNKTATAICLVTPDSERTFVDNMGAAITLNEEEIILDDLENSKILYVTGYILEDKNLRAVAIKALKKAKELGKRIAIDVSDPALVGRCKEDLKNIIQDYADILFANEDEAFELTGKRNEEALGTISSLASISIVKIGKEGSLINEKGTIHKVPGFVVEAVDTTGAGDMFAAGFLFGITHDYNVKDSALIGNFAASKVVQLMGGRLDKDIKEEINQLFK